MKSEVCSYHVNLVFTYIEWHMFYTIFFLLFLIHVHHINMIFYFMIITLAILRFRSILHITPLCVHELNEEGCS